MSHLLRHSTPSPRDVWFIL